MSMDIATLGLEIKTDKVKAGIDALTGLQQAGDRAERSAGNLGSAFNQVDSAASSCAAAVAKITGVTLSLAGAFYAAEKATSSWFNLLSGGISTVDEYQKKIISASYILSTMSDVKTPDLSKAYGEWKDYFAWWYRQSLEADKKAAASAQEIFAVGTELAKKGVVIRKESWEADRDTIARLTDLMKAVTPGYMNFEQQARGEVGALMEGAARMGAQTAQILSQIDPEFKKNITSAREQGTVLEYIRSILPQIKQYTLDLMGTWDAVGASLKSAWSVINLKAFGNAHREVVGLAEQLASRLVDNGQLTKEGERAAIALSNAWNSARERIIEAFDYLLKNSGQIIKDVGTIASVVGSIAGGAFSAAQGIIQMARELRALSDSPWIGALIGGAAGSRLGIWGALGGATLGFRAQVHRRPAREIEEFKGDKLPGEGLSLPSPSLDGPPPTSKVRKPSTDTDTGRAIDSLQKRLENFIQRLKIESAKAADEPFVALEEWRKKEASELARMEAALGISFAAREALESAYYSKRQALIDKFSEKEKKRHDESAKNQEKVWLDSLSLQKSLFDQLSALWPTELGFKQKALDLEIQINRATSDRKLMELERAGSVSKEQAAEIRGWEAILAAQKRYNLAMEYDKGLSGWAFGRVKAENQKNTWANAMEGAESFITDAFSQGIQGALSKTQVDWKETAKTMAVSFALNLGKQGIHWGFTQIAKGVLGASGIGQPGLTPARPLYVVEVGGKGNLGGAGQLGDLLSGNFDNEISFGNIPNIQEWNEVTGQWELVNAEFQNTFLEGSSLLTGAGSSILEFITQGASSLIEGISSIFGLVGKIGGEILGFLPFFHGGGPIYAHAGWPRLLPDEVPIIAKTGERVLSRAQNRDYEAGMRAAGGGGGQVINISIDARGADKSINWKRIVQKEILPVLIEERDRGRAF